MKRQVGKKGLGNERGSVKIKNGEGETRTQGGVIEKGENPTTGTNRVRQKHLMVCGWRGVPKGV